MGEDTQRSSPRGRTDLWVSALSVGTRAIQLLLSSLLLYTIVIADIGLAINTGLMLALSFVPDALQRRYHLRALPVVAFLVALAAILHAVGAAGPYRTVPMFDQVAHAVSATLIAGFGYVIVRALEIEYDDVRIPPSLRVVFILVFATSFGVAWEILEFATGLLATVIGGEPLLAQYGPSDVVLDLLFNSLGGVVVALWGTSYFDGLRRAVVGRFVDS